MSMFSDIELTKKGKTETCLHNAEEVGALVTQFKPGHWYFLGPASENTWWNGNSNELQGLLDVVALQMVDMFKCHTSHPILEATLSC